MSKGNFIFVVSWTILVALVARDAGFNMAALLLVVGLYLLTGTFFTIISAGTWRTVVGWLPAFVVPRVYAWTRGEE